jgi:phage terminase large subunit
MANKTVSVPMALAVKMELWRRGCFDFITTRDGKKHEKQSLALQILTDEDHVEILYGGAAGGAKSWTGAVWLLFMCLCYAGTKWFVGRAELKRITQSTYITFKRVAKMYGVSDDLWKYNGQLNYIEFWNGSRIDFLDLKYIPSDPLYERYGSIEFTGGWIEEGGEVNFGAYDTLKTRVGRCLNAELGLKRKLFITCNPKKNWMYDTFYKPWKTGVLLEYRFYIACLVQENPFIDPDYIEGLRSTADKVKFERLFKGNWDYDDNPNALCSYDAICAIFGNKIALRNGKFYITGDIARFGADYARLAVWDGWCIVEKISMATSKTTDIQTWIINKQKKYRIPNYRCIVDEDGVGGGVVDNCEIQGFVNNSVALAGENYRNLQAQCGYKLAEHINANEVGMEEDIVSQAEREEIVRELEQLQTWKGDSDGKLQLKPKEEIKVDIGHSPDWRDLFLMRSWFDYNEVEIPDNIEQILGLT